MSIDYRTHLTKDKRLKILVESHGRFTLRKRRDLCLYLCGSVMSQQLSTKVADVIYSRFLNLFEGNKPTPEQILGISHETFRSIGLSNAKSSYIRNVAKFTIENGLQHRILGKMSNEEIIDYLTQIKGVGRWTVEMLLMFALGREDVFSIDDHGIKTAMVNLYKIDQSDKIIAREKMIRISKKWSPYRTYACLHLWRWKDS